VIERYTLEEMGSVFSDEARFGRWLEVELAVSEVLAEDGFISSEDFEALRTRASFDVAEIAELEKTTEHDVVAFVTCVARRVGEAGRHLHRGLTSSDVVDTAFSLSLLRASDVIAKSLEDLERTVTALAWRHAETVMVGRTHGVHAEPTTFGAKVAGWVQEIRRHKRRLSNAREDVAVGKISGPVGTYRHLGPEVERRALAKLGLNPAPVSTQILQRDRHAHVMCTLAGIASSLDKFALEIRHLARTEVREVEEPFRSGQTGSSAMPHKRNPVLSERVSGLARVVRGHALVGLENVALWHERDISHSSAERVVFPDAFIATHYMLVMLDRIVRGLRVFPERMRRNLEATRGLIHSSRVLDALVAAGMAREPAYRLVQSAAMRVLDGDAEDLRTLLGREPTVQAHLSDAALDACFSLGPCLEHVGEILARALGPRRDAPASE
jgi:adenylosuccinate lyase